MMTAQVIDPERLKQARKLRGLTQGELAQRARKNQTPLNKQTVYRLERPLEKGRAAVRKETIERLARALDFEPEVLTGEKPIPLDASEPSAPADEAAYQLKVRVDAPIRNAFELVARRYRVSVPKIAQLAPLLFVIIAEASLKHRCKKLDELEAALDRVAEAESDFPHLRLQTDEQERGIRAERASIKNRDLFGREKFDPYGVSQFLDEGEDNPFAAYLKALTAGRDDITVRAFGPTSTEYRVCRSEAIDLAKGDEQVAEWLLNGEVPIHRIPRGKTVDIEWMRHNKISVRKVPEEVPGEFPGAVAINFDDIEL
jgi:transcriptional regulator with XRE-family HTH domain